MGFSLLLSRVSADPGARRGATRIARASEGAQSEAVQLRDVQPSTCGTAGDVRVTRGSLTRFSCPATRFVARSFTSCCGVDWRGSLGDQPGAATDAAAFL